MINVHMAKRADLESNDTVVRAVKMTEEKLAGRGRVLLRPSGTEPVVRVMVEGEDKKQVKELAQELAAVVETALS
jgi:phosphoglucosamine mutase